VFLGTRVIVLTAGPARMADNFLVDLPHPRTLDMKTQERFGEYTRPDLSTPGNGIARR
jgi:NitT/TauT family transport system ATP-binding protein